MILRLNHSMESFKRLFITHIRLIILIRKSSLIRTETELIISNKMICNLWVSSITQSFKAAEVADRLKAGGYVPSMTQTRSLISAFRGIFAMMNDTPWDFV